MKRSLSLGVVVVLSLGACTGENPGPSWEEFRATVYQEPDTGVFIVNGDEPAASEEELRAFYDRMMTLDATPAETRAESRVGTLAQPLIVNRFLGSDDKWSAQKAGSITYCVSKSSFGSQYAAVVAALNTAAVAWEATARVNFVHSSQYDGNCSWLSPTVFNVRRVTGGQYLARAFFPSYLRFSREVLIDASSLGNIAPWTLAGVLRHELGHTVGFRHEHTRPQSGRCFEDNQWRALTVYDAASVMHYPQCNGTNKGDLVLSANDKSGARALYP